MLTAAALFIAATGVIVIWSTRLPDHAGPGRISQRHAALITAALSAVNAAILVALAGGGAWNLTATAALAGYVSWIAIQHKRRATKS